MRLNSMPQSSLIASLLGLTLIVGTSAILPIYADNLLIPRIGLTTNGDKVLTIQRTLPASEVKTPEKTAETPEDKDSKDKKDKAKKDGNSFIRRWMEKKQKQAANAPVAGEYFLYDIKSKHLLYKAEGRSRQNDTHKFLWFGKKENSDTIGQNQIAFDKAVPEGLYNVVVQGSGHDEEAPVWVSDSIYWEAIKPVIRDISSYHCPHLKGHFQTIQSCYALQAETNNPTDIYGEGSTKLIKGGWYTGELSNGSVSQVKDTTHISKMTTALLNLYSLNPESYNYLEIKGVSYQQSPLPDLIDEANWGIQYLLSMQDSTSGGFSNGVEQENYRTYKLQPVSPEATAYAITALTQGAEQYKKIDLAYSIQLIKASEKAWQYLSQSSASSELKYMAASSLASATGNTNYNMTAQQYLGSSNTVSADTAFMLGHSRMIGAKNTVPAETIGTVPTEILPYLNKLAEQPDANTYKAISQFVESLYGYEEVAFKPNISYKVASATRDPLAFLAFKSGVVITKVNNSLEGSNILIGGKDLPKDFLQDLEKKQNDAMFLSKKGYSEQNMSLLDKAYLAYTLGLLNQNVSVLQPVLTEKQRKKLNQPMPEELIQQRPKLPANLPSTVPN